MAPAELSTPSRKSPRKPSSPDKTPKVRKSQPNQTGSSVKLSENPLVMSLPDYTAARPTALNDRIKFVSQNANFMTKRLHVKDGVIMHMFVRHEAFTEKNVELPNDGTYFPEERQKKAGESTKKFASSPFAKAGHYDDAGAISDSGSESDQQIDIHDDTEQSNTLFAHRFTIDIVARYPDMEDSLVFHWGMSRKKEGAWGTPDQAFFPPFTNAMKDGLACQTTLQRDAENRNICSTTISLKWLVDTDTPITSISFVVMEPGKNLWHSPEGVDQVMVFSPNKDFDEPAFGGGFEGVPRGQLGEVVNDILNFEVHCSHMTLMHRYFKARDVMKGGRMDMTNRDHVVYLYIWLRYSFTKQLTWQKSYNTKPKELQHACVCVTDEICEQFKRLKEGDATNFLCAGDLVRMTTCMVGKGTGNGQAIRDEILHIMHRHKISERAGHFYEQWHQKLHNNTTPEDIPICEALLAYLKSGGNMSEYWRVLTSAGINRERLASYERKITEEPWYKPEAIHDFENYLQILKRVHSSDDLNHLIGDVWHKVGNDTQGLLKDLQSNFKDHDVVRQLGRVYNLRANLCHHHYDMNNTTKLKDVMFLDLALEAYARTLTERIMHVDIGYEGYIHEVALLLKHLALSFKWEELGYLKDDWQNIVVAVGKNLTEDNARRVKSVIDRVKSALAEVNEVIETVMQKKAEVMGYAFRAQDWSVKLFSEEVLRGTLFFSLSMILKKIDPHVRQCAHLGDWLIISNGRAHGSRGYVEYVPRLADVMHKTYEQRTVLMVDKITGEEEVPENVQAIILMNESDYPDVLAHVSVRARNLKVLLSVMFDESRYKDLKALVGKHLKLDVANQVVQYQQQSPEVALTRRASSALLLGADTKEAARNMKPPPMFKNCVMQMSEFSREHSGAKSNNLQILSKKLDKSLLLPESVVLPFQLCEYTLGLNKGIQKQYDQLLAKISKTKNVDRMTKYLNQFKELVNSLPFVESDGHHRFLKQALLQFGIPANQFDQAWSTIKRTWASKFNERAFLSTRKLGIRIEQIYMAVLVQKIIPAEHAYVIHTTNPTNLEDDEVYVEACKGLGEALVSDMPGQALSFSYHKRSKNVTLGHYPNKPLGLNSTGFIFRSDSNSEDLPGFAGAGLFDSYPMNDTNQFRIAYHSSRVFKDQSFLNGFMKRLGEIGVHIEQIYDDDAQDIEGCFYNNQFYVVQTRPQV